MKLIERRWDGKPTIFENSIEENSILCNTLVGYGNIIIDKTFLEDMDLVFEKAKNNVKDGLVVLLTKLYNDIKNYYCSEETNSLSRGQAYSKYAEYDEDGAEIGTKLSNLKGKNISKCSEKTIAAYVILNKMYSLGIIKYKPSLVLSQMAIESSKEEPHAFLMLNRDIKEENLRHILFDVENLSLIEIPNGKQSLVVGLYSLNEEEYSDLINGLCCTPTSLYDKVMNYKEINEKRTYGNIKKNKSKK